MRNENMSNTATISQGQEILALQDELTGALIGLARSCGNNPKTENTDEIIIEGLVHTITNSNTGAAALKAMIEKVREEKNTVAPDCAVCAAPCGNTSEYDVSNIWKHETDVRGVETAILFGISHYLPGGRYGENGCRSERIFLQGTLHDQLWNE